MNWLPIFYIPFRSNIFLEYAKNFYKQKLVPDVIIGSSEANEKLLNNPANPMIWQLMNRMGRYLGNPDKLQEMEKLLDSSEGEGLPDPADKDKQEGD